MTLSSTILSFGFLALVLFGVSPAVATPLSRSLRVGENGRFLAHADGSPFFYLGDAAYMLFFNLSDEEIEVYLKDRAAKGFTVIEAGLTRGIPQMTTVNGDRTFHPLATNSKADDFTRPNEAFFAHVDRAVEAAESNGLYLMLFPIWDKLLENIRPEHAYQYGEYLGRRYRGRLVLWSLVGDADPRGHEVTVRALAAGLRMGHGGTQLMTFKPRGGSSSSVAFHQDDWLDFNSIQGSHSWFRPTGNSRPSLIARDYRKIPVKPTMDSESGFENIPEGLSRRGTRSMWAKVPAEERFKTHDVRRVAYWTVFAGGFGFTYGANGIYQFTKNSLDYSQRWDPGMEWREALNLPGAGQMRFLRQLMESRPFFDRIPDQSIVASPVGEREAWVQATRSSDNSFVMVYLAYGQSVSLSLQTLAGERVVATWYNPRDGKTVPIGILGKEGVRRFTPPSSGRENDWVLVLDDEARGFPPPGVTYGENRQEVGSLERQRQ